MVREDQLCLQLGFLKHWSETDRGTVALGEASEGSHHAPRVYGLGSVGNVTGL